jgi:GT2 family glycosyltransferase
LSACGFAERLAPDAPPTTNLIDISVCIANWNCRELLRTCLKSLRDQREETALETIVVDNGSTDGAAEMVAEDFPEVILVRNESNRGFSRASNQAARLSRGRYLFFLNNDTVVPPGALTKLAAYADANPRFGILGPRLRDGQGKVQVSCRPRLSVTALLHRTWLLRWTGLLRRTYYRCRREEFDPDRTRSVDVLMGAAMLIPREVFFRIGQWDEDYVFGGEDMDLCFRIGRLHPVIYHPEVEIIHFGRVSSRQHVEFAPPQIACGFVRYLRKTGSSAQALWTYKFLVTLDTPLQLLVKGLQYFWRRMTGRKIQAEKSRVAFLGAWYFLTRGLKAFWKA